MNENLDELMDTVGDNEHNDVLGDLDTENCDVEEDLRNIRIPTQQPTFSSPKPPTPPTTDTILPKRKEQILDLTDDSMAIITSENERYKNMEAKYRRLLSSQDPVALSVKAMNEILEQGPKRYIFSFELTRYTLMQLFEGQWLDDDMLGIFAEMLSRDNPRTQVLHAALMAWELEAVRNPNGAGASDSAGFTLEPSTTTILIPTNVNNNHWMLCVARVPTTSTEGGTLEYYNSLHSTYWDDICREGAHDVNNTDDCGVFVAACAVAVVLDIPVPARVDKFRGVMATQVVRLVTGETLDWDLIKIYLASQEERERQDMVDDYHSTR
ncbi:hypothetical protein BDR22DRAFT_884536 [Usnea florida]